MLKEETKLTHSLLRLEGKPFHRGGVRFQRGLLGFTFDGGFFVGEPYRPFVPHGLAIWGAPAGARLIQALIKCDQQVSMSHAPVPARFFAFGDSYEQIAKLLDEGKEPPTWADWDVIELGSRVRITLESVDNKLLTPADGIELVMWGVAAVRL